LLLKGVVNKNELQELILSSHFSPNFLSDFVGFFSSDFLIVLYTEMEALVGSGNEDDAMLPFKHSLKFSKSKIFQIFRNPFSTNG